MSKKFLFSFALVVILAANSYGVDPYVIGDWEGSYDNWEINEVNATIDYNSNAATLTLGSQCLKVDVNAGWNLLMGYDLLADGNDTNAFKENKVFMIDVTRRLDCNFPEWCGETAGGTCGDPPAGAYSQLFVVVQADDGNGLQWRQLYENGQWAYGKVYEAHPERNNIQTTFTYDYNAVLGGINLNTLTTLNVFLITNWNNYSTGKGVYYLDNARLATPAPATLLGDFEDSGLDGWVIAAGVSGLTISSDSTGATLHNKALKLVAPIGWTNGVMLDLKAKNLVDTFKRGQMISADITRLDADWTEKPGTIGGWTNGLRLIINANALAGGDFWQTTTSSSTIWPAPADFYVTDINLPIKCYFAYTPYLQYIDFNNLEYLKINFCTNSGNCWDGGGIFYLDNVQLHSEPAYTASNPKPPHTNGDVPLNQALGWTAGLLALGGHDVYFGTSEANVIDANHTAPEFKGNQTGTTYDPIGLLVPDINYYWRIDEVNDNDVNVWKGEVWRFKTGRGIVIEDFDSYASTTALRTVWEINYESGPTNTVETAKIHSGQSMKYLYEDIAYYNYFSEIDVNVLSLPSGIGTDWTIGGAKSLALYFYGLGDNDPNEPMYVRLYDADSNATVTYGYYADEDTNALKEPWWHQWNIDLADFVDVNQKNIKKMTIGFGDKTGPEIDDIVYFDDIRLYAPKCVSARTTADVNGDCKVNYIDLGILTDYWLADVSLTAPSDTGLVGMWKLDGDACDTGLLPANNGVLAGTASKTPDWVSGRHADSNGWALEFKDVDADRVNCGNDTSLNLTTAATVAAWIKTYDCGNGNTNTYVSKGHYTDVPIVKGGAYGLWHNASNNIEFFVYAGTDTTTPHSATYPVDGSFNDVGDVNKVWHHVAGTYDGSSVKLYVDGLLKDITPCTGNIKTNSKRLLFAASETGSSTQQEFYYDGRIDEVRIYNRALTPAEIMNLSEKHVDLNRDEIVDFLDFASFAAKWLGEDFWP
ncbi:MAG: LamG domain-containing protein [Phycisphaerae bacterium]|nr:LamG domain-containing protein [Phycisphaerae bacterium]